MNANDFTGEYRKQIERQLGLQGNTRIPSADVERPSRRQSMEAKKDSRLDSPCCIDACVNIVVTGYRHRLCDSDGQSCKALIDAFVLAKILKDDRPEFVNSVATKQVKIPKEEPEYIVVEMFET